MSHSLSSARIELRPLRISDSDQLVEAATDGELWNLPFTFVPSKDTIRQYVQTALQGVADGTMMPFVIVLRENNQIIGSTRFWRIDRKYRTLEIGSTWISTAWQRTFVNTEIKYLMLRYAFEELDCIRVQFMTDEINTKSRSAILRLGAKEEGIMRNERIMPNGRKRNSIIFSIIDEEWVEVKQRLETKLEMN
jgi:RimJ/RimL family protein N-acetyltransferase